MSFRAKALMALRHHGNVVLVTVNSVVGSAPREVGAQMLITPEGFLGSIGGGTLEWQAMAQAQAMLQKRQNFRASNFVLGPDLGQCCGGRVGLAMQRHSDATSLALAIGDKPKRQLILFGAGHVGRALVLILAQSEFDIVWVDPRPQAFPEATPQNVRVQNGLNPLVELVDVPQRSLVLVMSHSHELDFAITDTALRQSEVAKLGLIGSNTKRARFLSRLRAAGHTDDRLQDLICPIGTGGITSKKPYGIALSTAAQLVALDEALSLTQTVGMVKVHLS